MHENNKDLKRIKTLRKDESVGKSAAKIKCVSLRSVQTQAEHTHKIFKRFAFVIFPT